MQEIIQLRLASGLFLERWQYNQRRHSIGHLRRNSARWITLAHFRLRSSRRLPDEYYIALGTFSSLPLCGTYAELMYHFAAFMRRPMYAWCIAWGVQPRYKTCWHVRLVTLNLGLGYITHDSHSPRGNDRVRNELVDKKTYSDATSASLQIYEVYRVIQLYTTPQTTCQLQSIIGLRRSVAMPASWAMQKTLCSSAFKLWAVLQIIVVGPSSGNAHYLVLFFRSSHFINQIKYSTNQCKDMSQLVMTRWGTSQTLASILGLTNLVQGLHSLMSFCTAWTGIQNACQKSRVVMTRPLPTVVGILYPDDELSYVHVFSGMF